MQTSPADLKHRITLQAQQTRAADGMGGFTITWNSIATIWAKKTTHRSDEAVQAMATTGITIHNYRIRYRTDIKHSWRILDGNKYMNIVGITEVERRTWLDITAKEVI